MPLLGTATAASTPTASVPIGAAVAAGRAVIVGAAWSNDTAAVPTVTAITDSRGNEYTVDSAGGTGNATVSCAIIRGTITTPLQAGDEITVTISAPRLRWALQAEDFENVGPLDQVAARHAGGVSAAMTTGVTSPTTTPDELVIACWGFGRGGLADCELDPGWSGSPYVTTSAGSADRALQLASKTVTAVGPHEGTATLSVASAYAGCIATYAIVGPPPTFPSAALDLHAELYIPGVGWVDTIDRALTRDPVTITRGRADESARPGPSRASLTLRDQDGKWAGRNPRSPYFGLLGRNTRLRLRVGDEPVYGYMPGTVGSYLATPDTAVLDLTDVVDVRMDITPDAWRSNPEGRLLAAKLSLDSSQQSWAFIRRSAGQLRLLWSPDGTSAARIGVSSTVPIPVDSGRLAVRAALEGDNGAGGYTVTFYTAPTIDGPWTPLGDPVVGAGVTSVFASTADLMIGAGYVGGPVFSDLLQFHGRLHGFQLADGAGIVVADPGILDQAEDATEWTGPDGLIWTAHGTARILRPARGHFEVASWPPTWHVSGHDVCVPLKAAGLRQRLSQGKAPIQSALRRAIPSTEGIEAYWPMEDAGGQFASALFTGAPPLIGTGQGIDYASDEEFVGSAALPSFGTGTVTGAVPYLGLKASDNPAVVVSSQTVMFLLHTPDAAFDGPRRLIRVDVPGTAARWDLFLSATGQLGVSMYDQAGTQVDSFVFAAVETAGKLLRVGWTITERTTGVDYNVEVIEQGGGLESYNGGGSGVVGAWTVGQIQRVTIGEAKDLSGTTIGHVTVYNRWTFVRDLNAEFDGFAGERAADRIARLGAEHNVRTIVRGDPAETVRMGPQRTGTLLELMDQAADADGGILHDARDDLALEYRTRSSMYNQDVSVALDYTARGEVPPPLQPVEDDQAIRNDVTATRDGGSSARRVQEDGPLSVLPPEDGGIGTYDEAVTVNVQSDAHLPHIAGWRVHLGTWDAARFPTVVMWPHTAPQHLEAIKALDVGDRFTVTNPPPWLPPEDIDLLAQGYTEVLKPWSWETKVNASPAGPWTVAVVDEARVDTGGSELVTAVDTDDTTFTVATTRGPAWTLDPADLPIPLMVGGEAVTATAIADGLVDGFDRTVSNGWGTAPDGRAWTVLAGAAADFSVSASAGEISVGTRNAARLAALAHPHESADFEVAFRSPAATITGAPVYVALVARLDSDLSGYQMRVSFGTDGRLRVMLQWRANGGSPSALTAEKVVPGSVSGSALYRARLSVQGNQILGKVWTDGGDVPGWQIACATDASFPVGDIGVQALVDASNTNTLPLVVGLDEVVIHNPQTFTVIRSVNGIVKPQPAGTAVALARPAVIGL